MLINFINPSFKILNIPNRHDILTNLEKYARTCYKSENKITSDSASKFIKGIVKSGHHSVIEHINMTVRFICDRGVLAELTRHRIASFSVESTRYCNYGNKITFILPHWSNINDTIVDINDFDFDTSLFKYKIDWWIFSCLISAYNYKNLINCGCKAQDARSVLNHSLKTEIIMTANLREWIHVFNLRCSNAAHPEIRRIMIPLRNHMKKLLPEVYGE